MIIEVRRIAHEAKFTIGVMHVDGEKFCHTLEDKVRDLSTESKVYGETAIPAGEYEVYVCMSPKFRRELPRLKHVPYFEGILIHRGNTAKDTAGCILVGDYKGGDCVVNSTHYEIEIVKLCKEAEKRGEKIIIRIYNQ